MYLLDTNIVIYLIRKKELRVMERFRRIAPSEVYISTISVAELEYGVYKSNQIEKNKNALEEFLSFLNVIQFNTASAQEYGRIRYILEKAGTPIGPLDTLIAAHALSQDYILVTNNEKEFKRVEGLKVENWMS